MVRLALVSILVSVLMAMAFCSWAIADRPARSFYADEEVLEFIEEYPGLAGFTEGERVPENVLRRLSIDTNALDVLEIYIGGCVDMTVYDLSPGYELVVDRNACSGFGVAIRPKQEDNSAPP